MIDLHFAVFLPLQTTTKTLPLLDLYANWTWFSSSAGVLTSASDAILFHLMGSHFWDHAKLEDPVGAKVKARRRSRTVSLCFPRHDTKFLHWG